MTDIPIRFDCECGSKQILEAGRKAHLITAKHCRYEGKNVPPKKIYKYSHFDTEYHRQWKQDNADKERARLKEYRLTNRDRLKEADRQRYIRQGKIECPCGQQVVKRAYKVHLSSARHKLWEAANS